jgi:PAS domain S-box-containing protein
VGFFISCPARGFKMARKLSYEELGKKLKGLEAEVLSWQRHAEEIQERKEFVESILDASPYPVYVIDTSDYGIRMANSTAEQDLSRGKTCYATMHKCDRPCTSAERRCPVEIIKETKRPVTVEHIHYDGDGNPRHVDIHAYPIFDRAGRVSHIGEYILDVTERKQGKEKLRIKESALASSIVAIAMADLEGNLTYTNDAFLKLWGFNDEKEVLGKPAIKFWQTEQRTEGVIEAVRKTGGWLGELVAKKKDGSTLDVQLSASMVTNETGRPICMMGSFIDVSERKRMLEAIAEREEQYRVLVETMNEGLGVLDPDGFWKYANENLLNMLRYEKDELIGRPVKDFLDESNQAILEEQRTRRRKGEKSRYELAFTSKYGSKIPTVVSGAPIFDAEGHFQGSFAVIADISDLKSLHEKLQEKAVNLEELNAALKIMLRRREEDRIESEEQILLNFEQLIEPYLEKLKNSRLNERQKTYAEILESNLNEIISPFSRKLSSKYLKFTPSEIQVANLVKQGRSTKEIAEILNLSTRTIAFHRENIRGKLGLTKKSENLRSHLVALA